MYGNIIALRRVLPNRRNAVIYGSKMRGTKMTDIEELQKMYDESSYVVFFGGAGVSTESGIPDFRSADGLYNMHYSVPPEVILSHSYFMTHPEEFYEFYRDKLLNPEVKPNIAHLKLAEMEQKGKLKAVITQNIDGLHEKAGSKNVYNLHGSVYFNHCMNCGKPFSFTDMLSCKGVPHCTCGGIIKPDVVLYEEPLNENTVNGAVRHIMNADMLIVAGTSLTVYPAAGLIRYFRGRNSVLINRDMNVGDDEFSLVIHGKVGEILGKLRA